jgi:hypothetical protein
MKVSLINIIFLLVMLVALMVASVFISRQSSQAFGQFESPISIFLPLAYNDYPYLSVFGVTINPLSAQGGLDLITQAGVQWSRLSISWNAVEQNYGGRIWGAVADLDTQIVNATSHDIQLILVLEDTPIWALKPGYNCGAVEQEKLSNLGDFVYDLVSRYSQPPYNIHYYELWNEPDVVGILGCWGDASDPYYGGGYYAEMLKAVYPRIKAADLHAQVLVGGLLLDCDPSTPQPNCIGEYEYKSTSSKFLEGILANGGGDYFDGVSFHAYDYYTVPGQYSNSNWFSSSNWDGSSQATGPVALVKAGYLHRLLLQYNQTGKYLVNTELALLSGTTACQTPVDQNYEQTKSAYLVESYVMTLVDGFKASLWYSTLGWRGSCLLDSNLNPRPAYDALQTTRDELFDASLLQPVPAELTGVTGYEFTRGNGTIWVIWSKDGTPQTVTLTQLPFTVKSMTGVVITPSLILNDVDWRPIFIEFPR